MLAKLYKSWIRPMGRDAANLVLDTLFPISCIPCGKEGNFICTNCKIKLTKVERQLCIACKKPSPFGMTHSGCSTPHGPDGLISILDYRDEKVSDIIISGKYSFLPGLFSELGEIVANEIDLHHGFLLGEENNFTLTPLPLHPTRKRWRGFNQAEILCEIISERLGLPVIHALKRVKSTKTQKDLKKEARIKNMENAFLLSRIRYSLPYRLMFDGLKDDKYDVHNKNIILVDDVTTTGSTLMEAVKVLKRNGAHKVWCLTVARD